MDISISQKIKLALAYIGMSEAQLAREFNISPQAFNQRMKTGNFNESDLKRIAAILGAKYKHEFEFPDGTTF